MWRNRSQIHLFLRLKVPLWLPYPALPRPPVTPPVPPRGAINKLEVQWELDELLKVSGVVYVRFIQSESHCASALPASLY